MTDFSQVVLKEQMRHNAEVGRELVAKLRTEATQPEVEKYSLHVEEVDKITSLILGLSSRLAKTENTLANLKRGTWDEDEEVRLVINRPGVAGAVLQTPLLLIN